MWRAYWTPGGERVEVLQLMEKFHSLLLAYGHHSIIHLLIHFQALKLTCLIKQNIYYSFQSAVSTFLDFSHSVYMSTSLFCQLACIFLPVSLSASTSVLPQLNCLCCSISAYLFWPVSLTFLILSSMTLFLTVCLSLSAYLSLLSFMSTESLFPPSCLQYFSFCLSTYLCFLLSIGRSFSSLCLCLPFLSVYLISYFLFLFLSIYWGHCSFRSVSGGQGVLLSCWGA